MELRELMKKIYINFNLENDIIKVIPFGNGHINDTYRLSSNLDQPDYLLQKINHHIFKDIPELMENIDLVTSYISKKITPSEALEGQTTLTSIPAKDGQLFYLDDEGNYWRVFVFLDSLRSFDRAESDEQIYEGAKSFGRFLRRLSDFPAEKLHVTIPKFHDIKYRLNNLYSAASEDVMNRKRIVEPEIQFITETAPQLLQINSLSRKGAIPLRITHNDTKFNNLLFGNDNKGKCVIDLDTVMPGYVHYDFGDGIRTAVNTADEDEPDLDEVYVDMDKFEAFACGYLEMTRDVLSETEINSLSLSGPLFSFMMGVRFLTDYLKGDVYYKVLHETHNLERARCQLDFTKKMLSRMKDFDSIIMKEASTRFM